MFDRVVLGLDVGSYAVKAVQLRAGLRDVEFVRFEQLVLPPDAPPEEVEATIHLFIQRKELPLEFLVTALSTDRGTQRHLRFPFSGAKRVAAAVDFEIEEELPMQLESTIRTHEQVLARPDQTEVLVAIAPREEVQAHLDSMARMDFDPRVIEVEGASLANLFRYLNLSDLPRLVLDIGHRKTNLALIVDGRPVMLRHIPAAGRHLTEALAREHDLSFETAESLKHEAGVFEPGSTKPLSRALRDVLERLVHETTRSVQSMVSDPLGATAPTEIVLVGGSAVLRGLPDFFAERTGIPCRRLRIEREDEGAVAFANEGVAAFAQAASLALRGSATERTTQMDFRQGDLRYTADLSSLRNQLQLAVALFGLALLLWVASAASRMLTAESRVEALRAEVASIFHQTFPDSRREGSPLAAMEEEFAETQQLAEHLGVTGRGLSALDALREISSRVPTGLDISLDEVRLERNSIVTRGHTNDLASADRLRSQLAGFEGFGRVVISDVTTDARRGGKTFTMKIRLEDGE